MRLRCWLEVGKLKLLPKQWACTCLMSCDSIYGSFWVHWPSPAFLLSWGERIPHLRSPEVGVGGGFISSRLITYTVCNCSFGLQSYLQLTIESGSGTSSWRFKILLKGPTHDLTISSLKPCVTMSGSGTLGVRQEYTQDGMAVNCRAPCAHKHTLRLRAMYPHTAGSLGSGRKPMHAQTLTQARDWTRDAGAVMWKCYPLHHRHVLFAPYPSPPISINVHQFAVVWIWVRLFPASPTAGVLVPTTALHILVFSPTNLLINSTSWVKVGVFD